jgi:hypothetical protein
MADYEIGENAVITLTFNDDNTAIDGETITLVPSVLSGAIAWDCSGGTLEPNYRPSQCRP